MQLVLAARDSVRQTINGMHSGMVRNLRMLSINRTRQMALAWIRLPTMEFNSGDLTLLGENRNQ